MAFKGHLQATKALFKRKWLSRRGLFGSKGLLLYRGFQGGMAGRAYERRICHFLLKEMGKPSSPVYWVERSLHDNEPYRATNDHLVEIFGKGRWVLPKSSNCPAGCKLDSGTAFQANGDVNFEKRLWEFASNTSIKSRWNPPKRCTATMKVDIGPAEGLFSSKIEEIFSPALKRRFPFRLATTSYIFPAEILPNIRRPGPLF